MARLLACHEDMQQVGHGEKMDSFGWGRMSSLGFPCSYKTIHPKDLLEYWSMVPGISGKKLPSLAFLVPNLPCFHVSYARSVALNCFGSILFDAGYNHYEDLAWEAQTVKLTHSASKTIREFFSFRSYEVHISGLIREKPFFRQIDDYFEMSGSTCSTGVMWTPKW